MKLSIILFAVGLVASVGRPASAAIQRGVAERHPDHPNSCWIPRLNLAVRIGQSAVPPTTCSKVTCVEPLTPGSSPTYSQETCGSVGIPPGCTLDRDPALGYPKCCTNFVCVDRP